MAARPKGSHFGDTLPLTEQEVRAHLRQIFEDHYTLVVDSFCRSAQKADGEVNRDWGVTLPKRNRHACFKGEKEPIMRLSFGKNAALEVSADDMVFYLSGITENEKQALETMSNGVVEIIDSQCNRGVVRDACGAFIPIDQLHSLSQEVTKTLWVHHDAFVETAKQSPPSPTHYDRGCPAATNLIRDFRSSDTGREQGSRVASS